jgi:BNR/Asp-box repeat
MRRFSVLLTAALSVAAAAAPAEAAPFILGSTTVASALSPFAPGCGGPGEALASSVLFQNAEVETHSAVNPVDANNVVAFWQQDRWSDGGAHGNLAGYSRDGGMTWARSAPRFSRCAGGAGLGTAGDYERATDPWLSFSPNGRLHAISLSFDNSTARNAVLAAFSDDGGATWSTPRVLRFDNPRAVGNNFNDKETLTADPFNSSLVYATWQRIVSPSERSSQEAYANAASYYSEAWFTRSTDGGRTWEPARPVYRENGAFTQTIGNQVEILADGTLINGFNLIHAITNRHGSRGNNVALIRSPDKGLTW